LLALCSAVFCRHDEVLQLISDTPWYNHASVGDESSWVTKLRASVKSVGARLQCRLSSGDVSPLQSCSSPLQSCFVFGI
jgi:hypothetical protein